MTDRQKALIAILMAVPALLAACTAWVNAQAKAAETRAAYSNYGDYVTSQLERDQALVEALKDCLEYKRQKAYDRLASQMQAQDVYVPGEKGVTVGSVKPDTRQADEILDGIARSRGWEPGGVK